MSSRSKETGPWYKGSWALTPRGFPLIPGAGGLRVGGRRPQLRGVSEGDWGLGWKLPADPTLKRGRALAQRCPF